MKDDNTILHYDLIKLLGEGSAGQVYLARDLRTHAIVALKFLVPIVSFRSDAMERFRREHELLTKINHPNIIRVLSPLQSVDGRHFFVTEYVPGTDLDTLVRQQRRLTTAQTAGVLGQVLEGLEAAHQAGIIHRDLKPSNILVDSRFVVKVGDFSIAFDEEATSMTQPGEILGSPAYIAPEVWEGKRADARADLYAAGGVAFYMLTGRDPFVGNSAPEIMKKHLEEPVPRPSELGAEGAFDAFIEKALAKDRDARFQSALDMQAAIPGGTQHATDIQNLLMAGTIKVHTELVSSRSRRDMGPWWVALATAAVLCAGAITWKLARRAPEVPTETPQIVRQSFRGQDLKSRYWQNADLANADFTEADLTQAILAGANLKGAIFQRSNLQSASVQGADLTGADLMGANLLYTYYDWETKWPIGVNPEKRGCILNLQNKNLSGQDLTGRNLKGAILVNAKMKGAKLSKAVLTGATLVGADMSETDLKYALLQQAAMMGTDLRGADLSEADITNALYDLQTRWPEGYQPGQHGATLHLPDQNLVDVDWSGKDLTGANLAKASLTRAKLVGTILRGANLRGANLSEAILDDTRLSGAIYDLDTRWPKGFEPANREAILVLEGDGRDYSGRDLHGRNFKDAHMGQTLLNRVNFSSTLLMRAYLSQAHLEEADLSGADLTMAKLRGAILRKANLKGTDLSNAELEGADLKGAIYDKRTQWPKGVDPAARGAILQETK